MRLRKSIVDGFIPRDVTTDDSGGRITIELTLTGPWAIAPQPADFRLERLDGLPSTLQISELHRAADADGRPTTACSLVVGRTPGHDGAVARYRLSTRMAGGGAVTFFAGKVDRSDDPRPLLERVAQPPAATVAEIDYLARDYDSLQRLLRDRLTATLPEWTEDSPADLMNALVEIFAYVGDYLSYYQDAVSTEAYLSTARRRLSLRRHARLVDYLISEGSNARTWVEFRVSSRKVIPAGTALMTRRDAPTGEEMVFATMWPLSARPAHNAIDIWAPAVEQWSLPAGAIAAELVGQLAHIKPGHVLLFEQVRSPSTGQYADADPAMRHPVRVVKTRILGSGESVRTAIQWELEDALPWPIPVRARVGGQSVSRLSVVRANVTLADHGEWVMGERIAPLRVPATGLFRPRISVGPITRLDPFTGDQKADQSAAAVRAQEPRYAFAQIELWDPGMDEIWRPRWDLIGSGPDGRDFVVEVDDDGVFLRFGDGRNGARPRPGGHFEVRCRVGNGPEGNIGAEAINRLVQPLVGVVSVRNPLGAIGGTARQPAPEIRRLAAENAQRQRRCVVPSDYQRRVIDDVPGIDDAVVAIEPVGAGGLISVYVNRADGRQVDDHALRRAQAILDGYRMLDHLVEVRGPIYVPVAIHLLVFPTPSTLRNALYQSIDARLGRAGEPGEAFFHPANFRFGEALYLSAVIAAVSELEGVESIDVLQFGRRASQAPILAETPLTTFPSSGVIQVEPHEVIAGGAGVVFTVKPPISWRRA